MNTKNAQIINQEENILQYQYENTKLVFTVVDKMVYVMDDQENDVFENGVDLRLLKKSGIPMKLFYNDFFNKGYSLEDSLSNHYLNLVEPILNENKINAMFSETDDNFKYFYTESNIVFVINKTGERNVLFAYDYDDEDEVMFNHCLSSKDLEENGVDVKMFNNDFKGFILSSRDGKDQRDV